jgi:hypothetical protein
MAPFHKAFGKLTSTAGKFAKRNLASKNGMLRNTALMYGAGYIGLGTMIYGSNVSTNVLKGLHPGSAYPVSSGRFGTRTASQAGPAGIQGLKFNFRRK